MNSIASPSWSRLFLVVFSGLLLSVSTGCGASNEDWVPGDKDLCKALVSDLSEARTSVEKMRELFVDGAVPDQQCGSTIRRTSFLLLRPCRSVVTKPTWRLNSRITSATS